MKIWLTIIILCAGATVVAQTTRQEASPARPASRPSARPQGSAFSRSPARRSISATPSMPTIYEEVATRNIFVKGNQRPPPSQTGSEGAGAGSYNYVPTPTDLLLTGVSLTDTGKVAFLEDQQANQVTIVKIGDKISTGKVSGITLDSLDYQDSGGRTIRVKVGFNLAGGDVWGVSGSSSTQPSAQSSRVGPRAPGESMLDYLRRRRAAETAK